MMTRRVVVTGMGAVTAIGHGRQGYGRSAAWGISSPQSDAL